MQRRVFFGLMLAAAAAWWGGQLTAAEPKATTTTIYVSDMHCGACAKKIANKLYAVPGVVKVQTSVKEHFALVTPEADKKLSPKALWEAIEAVKFTPTKLVGPAGTFTEKPKS